MCWSLQVSDSPVRGLAFSPDGMIIATASQDKLARLYDAHTGTLLRELVGHGEGIIPPLIEGVFEIEFSPDGKSVITSGMDGTARIWNVATGDLLLTLAGSSRSPVTSAEYTPDQRYVITADIAGVLRVWDPVSGRLLASAPGVQTWATAICADSDRIATAHRDATIRLWRVSELLANLTEPYLTLEGHKAIVYDVDFNNDCTNMVSADGGGVVKFWEVASGRTMYSIPSATTAMFAIEYSPDDNFVAASGQDGLARLFYSGNAELLEAARLLVTRRFSEAECKQYFGAPCGEVEQLHPSADFRPRSFRRR